MNIIAFPHRPPAIGGPGSFQTRIEAVLKNRGWSVVYADDPATPNIVFIVGGTRKLLWLLYCKMRGTRIILRLDGINWQHRLAWPGLKDWIRAEITNLLVRVIRGWFADAVVYQSQFVADWWMREFGQSSKPNCIIFNGVDLDEFRPISNVSLNDNVNEVVCVEGSINGDPAVHMLQSISRWPIRVYGNISNKLLGKIVGHNNRKLFFMGAIPRKDVPVVLKGQKIFLNLETNPPCPNAVIEALASGVPVVGFDNGSLRELIGDEGGILIPYGADPWKLDIPLVDKLEPAIAQIFDRYEYYSRGARLRAESFFGLDQMVDKYVRVIETVMRK